MGRLMAALYDRATRASEVACLRAWRAELLRDLTGDVLEVGAGTGANLAFYPRDLRRLILSEPDRHMRTRLSARLEAEPRAIAELSAAGVENLPFPDGSFDAVVGTLVLCSVKSLDRALSEIHRVLKPRGRFIFLEHVAAESRPNRLKWQRRVEPLWKHLAGNCHLTRRTADAIVAGGFEMVGVQRESMRKAFPLVRPTVRGVARKGGASPGVR